MRQDRVVPMRRVSRSGWRCCICGLWSAAFAVCGLWFVVCGLWFVAYMNPSSVDLQGAIPRVIKCVHKDAAGRLRRGGTVLLARIGLLNALELRGAARL